MTGLYDWNPMPHTVDVACPSCGKPAVFEFAEVVRIVLKKDVEHFRRLPFFEYRFFRDGAGSGWHGAIYYAGLHGGTTSPIRDLPKGYLAEQWNHSQYLYRTHGLDLGAVRCTHCGCLRTHELHWPLDAFYRIEYRNQVLWSFNRESTTELLDYIRSDDRRVSGRRWQAHLRHVPAEFLTAKARVHVAKKLARLLNEGADGP